MAVDVTALEASHDQLQRTLARLEWALDQVARMQQAFEQLQHIQEAIDQLAQQQALQTQAMKYILQGRWDAPRNGSESAESVVVALDPSLQGKVRALRFDPACLENPNRL